MCAEHTSLHPGETVIPGGDVQDGFIYVYDMPSQFTEDLTQLPVQWHPSQYDYDQASIFALQSSPTNSPHGSRLCCRKMREACSSSRMGTARNGPVSVFISGLCSCPTCLCPIS